VLLFSSEEEAAGIHPDFLGILDTVLEKMHVRDIPDHKRRRIRELPRAIKREEEEEECDLIVPKSEIISSSSNSSRSRFGSSSNDLLADL
jgi:hypothetical protein